MRKVAVTAMQAHAAAQIATMNRELNTFLPVSKLPSELFVDIINHVLATLGGLKYYRALFGLSNVSTAWKALVDSTPTF